MRAPPANNNELFAVLGFAAFVAAALLYWQTPKQPMQPKQPIVVVQPKEEVIVTPATWGLGGGPGWASGRWLGEGDFKHHGRMDHPYSHQSPFSGHPSLPPPLPQPMPQMQPQRHQGPRIDPRLGPR